MWRCWSCHEGGDVIQFVRRYFNIGFYEAVHRLAADFDIEIEDTARIVSPDARLCSAIEAEIREHNRKELKMLKREIAERINDLTAVYRVLRRYHAPDHMLKDYEKEIEDLEFYEDFISRYYLFSQKYRAGVDRFYKNGVPLDKGIRHGIGKTDYAIHQTIDKIKRHIRYIEKEYAVEILNRTKLKAAA